AEDGIRDKLVTGVQTCALPICSQLAAVCLRSWNRKSEIPSALQTRKNATLTHSGCSLGKSTSADFVFLAPFRAPMTCFQFYNRLTLRNMRESTSLRSINPQRLLKIAFWVGLTIL